jgi:hypothetical protein
VQEKKKKERTLIQSQNGAIDKFIIKETKVSSDNQSVSPVTLALDIIPYNAAERSFSKLKLLKSYMCTMITQQRLNDLTTISLDSEMLEKIIIIITLRKLEKIIMRISSKILF